MKTIKNNLQLTAIATISSIIFLLFNKNELYRYILLFNLLMYLSYYFYYYLKNKNNNNALIYENKSIIHILYIISIFSIILFAFSYFINVYRNNLDTKSLLVAIGVFSCIVFSVVLGFITLNKWTKNSPKLKGIIPTYILGVLLSILIAIPTITIFFLITNPIGLN